MINAEYIKAVRLLLAVAPAIFRHGPFALKGGTAINLFLQDMPRLSVDLDVVVTDHLLTRDEAFAAISKGLDQARAELATMNCSAEMGATSQGDEVKLFVLRDRTRIKVEVNHVFRGTLWPVEMRPLSLQAQELFQTDLTLPVLHHHELYGSKLVAAMDRQHPRDLFDVLGLYESTGLTAGIVESFVSYLAGHNRPVHEVLFGREIEISGAFANEFAGMTELRVTLDTLHEVRQKLFRELPTLLTEPQRRFLIGLVHGQPDWKLMSCPHLAEMSAIKWKLANLQQLKKRNPAKFHAQSELLAEGFSNTGE